MIKDLDYMKMAYELAKKGMGKTSPNPMVGAVLVKGSRIAGTGWHQRCGGEHAEIAALKKAGAQARGAKLYVTLEPCGHFGRTPPCVDRIIASGISKVYVGMIDPNPLMKGKSIQRLRKAGITVEVGLLKEQLTKLNEVFVKYITARRPFTVAKSAQTLDGKIATVTGQSKWITSEKSRKFSHELRNYFDAIMVGINTVLKDDPRLNPAQKSKKIKKIILDSTLRTPLNARLFKGTEKSSVLIATTAKASPLKINLLSKKATVLICPSKGGHVDLQWLWNDLGRREISSLLIEGGARVIGRALKRNLVDKLFIFIAPKIVGDQEALSSVDGLQITDINQSVRLKNLTVYKIDQDIFIQGYVHGNH